MTILSATYCDADSSAVIAETIEAGAVLIPVSGDDYSGGWQAVLAEWSLTNPIQPFEPPVEPPQ